jgi:hypothetical protein
VLATSKGHILYGDTINFLFDNNSGAVTAQGLFFRTNPETPAPFSLVNMVEMILAVNQLVVASPVQDIAGFRFWPLVFFICHFAGGFSIFVWSLNIAD